MLLQQMALALTPYGWVRFKLTIPYMQVMICHFETVAELNSHKHTADQLCCGALSFVSHSKHTRLTSERVCCTGWKAQSIAAR